MRPAPLRRRAIESFIAVAVLVAIHAFASRLAVQDGPRSRWLSGASGVSVAYVFLHLLPKVAEASEHVSLGVGLEAAAFAIACSGLIVFYGLTRAAAYARDESGTQQTTPVVFWLHVGSFAVYNAIIGHLARVEEHESLTAFTIGIALHFAVVDYGLESDHREPYRRIGRWILIAAIVVGWSVSFAVRLPPVAIDVLVAFLAGGIILNVLKEELPEERESHFGAFAIGAITYAVLLIAV